MAGKANAPNWEALRQEYIEGDISMRELAKKHGVNANTLSHHARTGKWSEMRKKVRHKADAKLTQKAANKRARIAELREEYGVQVMEMAIDGITELRKTKSTRIVREFVTEPKKEGMPAVKTTEERDLSKYTNAVASILRILGLDDSSELSRERLAMQKQQKDGAEDMAAFNAAVISMAEMISHPSPNRLMEEVQPEEEAHD